MASEFPKDTIRQPPVGGGMIGRIKRLLVSPAAEWAAIDPEPDSAQGIFMRWAVPLAAIGPVATLIGMQIFGINLWLVSYHPSLMSSVATAVSQYALALIGVWVLALVIDGLAPTFGAAKNLTQAMKVAAFSMTAAWLAGIFGIIPNLAWLGLVGLYSLYLLWVGLPMLMKSPADKAVPYTVVSIIAAGIVLAVGHYVVNQVTGTFAPAPGTIGTPGGSITLGGTTIDTGKLEAQAAAIKASTDKMQASLTADGGAGAKAVDPATLQNLIPAALSGWNRTSIESTGGGAMGLNISDATAQFAAGDQSFHLKISDTGAMGSLAGIVNVTSSSQTATGYEKTALQDGNMVTEKWDNASKSGTYSVLVAKRFLVEAEGSAPSIDTLKGAVGSINLGSLASLAS